MEEVGLRHLDGKQTPSSFICTVSQKRNLKLGLKSSLVQPSQRLAGSGNYTGSLYRNVFIREKGEGRNGGLYDEMA